VTAQYKGGIGAYQASSTSASFSIAGQKTTTLVYTGATSGDYNDPFTAAATLTDPDGGAPIAGQTITFALSAGDTCHATTDGSGVASCPLIPTLAAGNRTLTVSFAGDTDYLSAQDFPAFTIRPEETTTTYTGPTVIRTGSGASLTLTAQLQEDGATDNDGDGGAPVPPGQTLTLSIGSGAQLQSCMGTTNASGVAQCTMPQFNGDLGPQPLGASFAGDSYYSASSDTSKTARAVAVESPVAPTATPTEMPTDTPTATPSETPKSTRTSTPRPTRSHAPLPLTLLTWSRSVSAGGLLAVRLHTLPHTRVSVTLQIMARKAVPTGKGTQRTRVTHLIVLYQVRLQGTANGRGQFSGSVRITYRPDKAVPARLTVTVRLAQRLASRTVGVRILPWRHARRT
jgi:hypothetical protein